MKPAMLDGAGMGMRIPVAIAACAVAASARRKAAATPTRARGAARVGGGGDPRGGEHRVGDAPRLGGDQRERVPETPAGAEQRRLVAVALAGDERGHGREMIRLEGVTHAEQRAEARAGHEFEYWHDGTRILYLRSCR